MSNDTIYGGLGNDTIFGGLGDDVILGGAGADLMDGGPGRDRLSYADALTSVVIDMLNASGVAEFLLSDPVLDLVAPRATALPWLAKARTNPCASVQ